MKAKLRLLAVVVLIFVLVYPGLPANAASTLTTLYFGEIVLTGGVMNGNFPNVWDLAACDLTLDAKVDLSGVLYATNAYAQSQLGLRTAGLANYNPDDGVWLFTDNSAANGLDLDDKLILQNLTGGDESAYVPAGAVTPVWFDRADTEGIYNVQLRVHYDALAAQGEARLSINEVAQHLDGTAIETGIPFTAADPAQMQVFYGIDGYGTTHTVKLSDVYISGCLVLETGQVNGGGAFYPEDTGEEGNVTPGGHATFAFVAKRKDLSSTGNLRFQYVLDDLQLVSDSYDWVTVSTVQGIFEGVGQLNGIPGYRFRVTAVDGDLFGGVDRFQIRIWTGLADYDHPTHLAEGYLSQGQIIVHKK